MRAHGFRGSPELWGTIPKHNIQYLTKGMGGCSSLQPWNNIINHKMLRAEGFPDTIQSHTFKAGLFTGMPSKLPAQLGE